MTLLISAFLISSHAMAIDFQKVSGTFEVSEKHKSESSNNDLAFGSFDLNPSNLRSPSSVQEKSAQKTPEMNEVTGTFE